MSSSRTVEMEQRQLETGDSTYVYAVEPSSPNAVEAGIQATYWRILFLPLFLSNNTVIMISSALLYPSQATHQFPVTSPMLDYIHTFRPPVRLRPQFPRIRIFSKYIPIGRPNHHTLELRIHNLKPATRGVVLPLFDGTVAQLGESGRGVVMSEELEEGVEGRGVGEAFAVDELVKFGWLGYFVEGEGHDWYSMSVVEEGMKGRVWGRVGKV